IGVKVSPNFYWLNYKTEGYVGNAQSFGVGIGFVSDFLISDNFMIKTGIDFYSIKLDYTMPFSTVISDQGKMSYSGTLHRQGKINYFDIPAVIKYIIKDSNKLSINAQLGLKFGCNYRAKSDETFTYIDLDMKHQTLYREKVNISDETAGIKLALVMGAGVEYKISKNVALYGTLMLNPGLTNILSGFNTTYTNTLNKATASNIELSIGIII
ncbi:PorT family protein, partial [Bacteroidales bacterium OttesenSCG-928-L14]|nr:PorT family protein [Bacteroidales bacterium OttesenSCG-928-L14]